jgi:outer membrane protein assembly factor BamB
MAAFLTISATAISADDWPEFRGKGRVGVWNETGIIEKFPQGGLTVLWRTPVKAGYAGPSVADGRVFVTDFSRTTGPRGIERVLCLDDKTGRVLWTREWEANYTGLSTNWAIGPRATPTVDGDRVYIVGAMGRLLSLDVKTGEILWEKDYVKDYGTEVPPWGMTGAPLVDGNRLIALVGGEPNAKVLAFDKMTGKEIWRALPSDSEPGYTQPIIITAGGTRQLIIWYPGALTSLDPVTGKVYWSEPSTVGAGMTVATAVQSGSYLLVSSFYNGSVMVELDDKRPTARLLWKGKSDSEIQTDGLHAVVNTPIIQDGYIYGICSYGQLRGLKAATGERVWETQAVTKERVRWASGLMVRNGDRVFINNDRGELIIARFAPDGYHEISRTQLIKPTSPPGNRRELVFVNWSHPAYANKHIYARNDEEIISFTLAADDYK